LLLEFAVLLICGMDARCVAEIPLAPATIPAQFHQYFAADLSAEQAAFLARSQVLNYADNFKAGITAPAWRSKPSWMLVAGADKAINADLQRWYAARAKSHTVEVAGASHAVYISHPKEVADIIESAARAVSK
jgi:pimeloyl-ACP methyl ester carboxylesterase